MANNDGVVSYFKDTDHFETEVRNVSVAECHTQTVEAIAPYDWLLSLMLAVGDPIPNFIAQKTVIFGTLYIRDYRIDRLDGNMGKLTINCVEAANRTKPYNVTVDVDLAQVEKNLVNHPLLKEATTQFQIRMWQMTDDSYKYDEDGQPQSMYRLEDDEEDTSLKAGDPLNAPTPLTDKWAIKYARMVLIGIESYSVYLPIVTQTSQYLSLPGVNIDRNTMAASGTANPDNIEVIGEFDTPPIFVAGFYDGLWLKNGDKFVQNANGSWTRTEQWTYTNDKRPAWIYAEGAAKIVVEGE